MGNQVGSDVTVTAPNVIVAGHPDLSRRLRATKRFPAVFDVASASELRDLGKSGEVRSPAAFLFAPDFDEDLPDGGVSPQANRLAASGHTVIVHGYFTKRGDVFDPEVVATAKPLTLAELLALLVVARPAAQPEPPPAPAATMSTSPADEPPSGLRAGGEPPSGTGADARDGDSSTLIPGYGELTIVHRGTGSVTYRAVHEESGTVVAVRVRLDGSETPMEELAALERASRSDHMVSALESGRTTAGQRYTASVYCPGGAHVPEPLPVGDSAGIAISMGRALQALHDEGLVHGDVRPGRILRGEAGPLLTGTATARGLAAPAAPGVLDPVPRERVDPGFAAPEALSQQPQTVRSDVYGLGATLWSLLAGSAPFAADGERALDETAPRVPRDDVPEWLGNALEKALARDPADRYPTARAFVDALEEGLQESPPGPPLKEAAPVPDPLPEQQAHFPEPQALFPEPQPLFPERQALFPERQALFPERQALLPEPQAQPPEPQALLPEPQAQSPEALLPERQALFPEPQALFPHQETVPESSRRPGITLLALLALVLAAVVLGAVSLWADSGTAERPRAASPRASAPASPTPTSSPTAVKPQNRYKPSQVRIVDGQISIEISWKDASGGKAAYYVVGGPAGRPPTTLATVPAGTTKTMILALNPSVEYCMTVVAVVDVDRVAYAEPVCTHRGRRGG
ncbi:serine/threonine protein kinase [Spirillospora sp. CA-142024]|uniref:serine/threonine protein kinase n=1 Tax=Spirillospora sp. CA-142024 TaxID=3240036 RepID=UPI003D90F2E3